MTTTNDLSTITTNVITLKRKAKNRSELGNYEKASELIQEAISLLESKKNNKSISDRDQLMILSELSEVYGVKGGIFRRWSLANNFLLEYMKESYNAYKAGANIEEQIKDQKPNTYTTLNKIISNIFLKSISSELTSISVEEELPELRSLEQQLKEQVESSLSPRHQDVWAWADLGLIQLLIGDENRPEVIFSGFSDLAPTDKVLNSLLSILEPLSKFDNEISRRAQAAVTFLKSKLSNA